MSPARTNEGYGYLTVYAPGAVPPASAVALPWAWCTRIGNALGSRVRYKCFAISGHVIPEVTFVQETEKLV